MSELDEKRKNLRRMELEINVARMETRLLELDEERQKIFESIKTQQGKLNSGEY
jgi:hypothetical protein